MTNLIESGLCFDINKGELVTWESTEMSSSKIDLKFGSFFADSPARCFSLGIKYYNGFFGCPRCTTKGMTKKDRTCFPELDAPLRTDESFLMKQQPEHHHFDSILVTKMKIMPIKQVPLDTMHLLYSGVTKKIIVCLTSFNLRNTNVCLSTFQKKEVNQRLAKAKETQPKEFSRRIRNITDFGLFKATEFRVFLLYTGMVVLKNIINPELYENFLLLVCAIRILSDKNEYNRNNECAKRMLRDFVIGFGENYGRHLISSVVHSLIHLAMEVQFQNAPLDDLGTWEFESCNSKLKIFAKKENLFVQQAYNRTMEKYSCYENISNDQLKTNEKTAIFLKQSNIELDSMSRLTKRTFKEIAFGKFKIDCCSNNKWFITNNKEIFEFFECYEITDCQNNIVTSKICARKILDKHSFFSLPIISDLLNIYESSGKISSSIFEMNVTEFKQKMFMINFELNIDSQKFIFIPMI